MIPLRTSALAALGQSHFAGSVCDATIAAWAIRSPWLGPGCAAAPAPGPRPGGWAWPGPAEAKRARAEASARAEDSPRILGPRFRSLAYAHDPCRTLKRYG